MSSQTTMCNKIIFLDFNLTLSIKLCDILSEETNVIVNASNTELFLGGGISGAIRQKGGKTIQQELDKIRKEKRFISEGDVEVTDSGLIKNKNLVKIFHAVGPIYQSNKNNDFLLKNAFLNSLKMAEKHGYSSISIPPISSGIFKYPLNLVCSVFYGTIIDFISEKIKRNEKFILNEINFCNNEEIGYNVMLNSLKELKENILRLGYRTQYISNQEELESQFPQEDIDPIKMIENNIKVMKEYNKLNNSNLKMNGKNKDYKSNTKITDFFAKKI